MLRPIHRSAVLIVAALLALLGVTGAAVGQSASEAEGVFTAEIELAERYRPVVLMKEQTGACDRDGEAWDPAPVEIVLDNPEVELLGPGGELITSAPSARDLFLAGPGTNLDFPGGSLRPGCQYEQDHQRFKEGEPDVVYAHVVQRPGVLDRIVLQYWFWWYFNDFNNTHEGDWEMLQLIFPAATAQEALEVAPIEVGLAQHAGGERADWDDDKLQKEGVRPVVYPAAGSHATQYSDALYLGRSSSEGIGCDDTRSPHRRSDPEPRVIPTQVFDPDARDAWVRWEGRWGERQPGTFDGPTGPITKKQWTQPITWQEDLRDTSTAVPGGTLLGPVTSNVFCETVAVGSQLLIDFIDSPVPVLIVLGTVLVLLGGAATRTGWSPAEPLPIRVVRDAGQILRAAFRMYARYPAVFVTAGLTFIPLALLASAIGGLTLDLQLGSASEATGERGGFTVALAPTMAALAAAIASAIVNAVAAAAFREVEAGRAATVRASFGTMWRSLRCFVPPLLGAFVIILVLIVTVIGIPVAIWLIVRWLFITPAAIIDERCGWDAARRSVDAVRGRWFRT
ncbi:MAG: hypothetical protein ACR2N6_03225, partial [Miltoncostaeaceae bacterium]